MSGESDKANLQTDCEFNISLDDQHKINKFALYNARLEAFKEELNTKINELKGWDDACEELAITPEDQTIPYLMGEIFICKTVKESQECLKKEKAQKEEEIAALMEKCDGFEREMLELREYLFNRFGDQINLDTD